MTSLFPSDYDLTLFPGDYVLNKSLNYPELQSSNTWRLKMGEIVMNKNDQKIYQLSMEVIYNRLSVSEFSILINKSYRQARRIINKIKNGGMAGVKHGNTNKTPSNKTSRETEIDVLALLKGKYYDFNLTHFKEMIEKHEGISVSKNIIHRIATRNNLVKRPKRRKLKKAYKPRPRMPREGMLIQFDGSEHNWFGGFISDLIGGIDDATGKVVGAEFFIGETSLHCMKVMKDIIEENGVPHAFYLDKAGAFGKDDRDQCSTQIGRALEEIGSDIILANSPQAKGKIERLWNTFQDRLIAELRLYDIKTIPKANQFLKEDFLPRFNKNFSYPARESETAYTNFEGDLASIFSVQETRKISMGDAFSYDGDKYIVDENRSYRFRNITINTHIDGSKSFSIMGRKVSVKRFGEQIDKKTIAA